MVDGSEGKSKPEMVEYWDTGMMEYWNEWMKVEEEIMDIKVLGPDALSANRRKRTVKEAVAEWVPTPRSNKVTNLLEMGKYGVFGTPAVVIDGPSQECRQNTYKG